MVEILVVVIIIAVLAGAMSLTININSEQKELQRQGQRLKHVLKFAHDHAIFTRRPLALEVFEDGIRFVELDEAEYDFMSWGLEQETVSEEVDSDASIAAYEAESSEDTLLKWVLKTSEKALSEYEVPEGFQYELEVDEVPVQLSALSDLEEDAEEADEEDEEVLYRPQIYFSDDGSVNSFVIRVTYDEKGLNTEVSMSMTGEILEESEQ